MKAKESAIDVPREGSQKLVIYLPIKDHNLHRHSYRQIRVLAKSIKTFGFNVPVLVDCEDRIVTGQYGDEDK